MMTQRRSAAQTPSDLDVTASDRILQAACKLFANKGIEATSTREICETARVTKPMLYYYFESKEGLCRGVIKGCMEALIGRLTIARSEPKSPIERLTEVTWAFYDFCQRNADFGKLFNSLYFGPEKPALTKDLDEVIGRCEQVLDDAVDEAVEAGLVNSAGRQSFGRAIRGLIHVSSVAVMKESAQLTRDLAAEDIRFLVKGYGRP